MSVSALSPGEDWFHGTRVDPGYRGRGFAKALLRHCDGNQSRAAIMLGIHRATLRKKLKDYGLAS